MRNRPFLCEVSTAGTRILCGKEVVIEGQNGSIDQKQSVPHLGCKGEHQGSPSSASLVLVVA